MLIFFRLALTSNIHEGSVCGKELLVQFLQTLRVDQLKEYAKATHQSHSSLHHAVLLVLGMFHKALEAF